jgi:ABC-type nitrate/sulfonate/bicarbonate transport system substrate-binding protein
VLATIAATPTGIAACGHRPTSRTTAKGRDRVTYLTGFGTTPREDYPYVGLAKGFFDQAGIEVAIKPGAPSDANLKFIAAGTVDFACVDFVSAVRAVRPVR